jgi:peptide chain release factor 1
MLFDKLLVSCQHLDRLHRTLLDLSARHEGFKLKEYKRISDCLQVNREIVEKEADHELVQLAKDEVANLEAQRNLYLMSSLSDLFLELPDEQTTLEIKPCAGGHEAGTFIPALIDYMDRFASGLCLQFKLVKQSPISALLYLEGRGSTQMLSLNAGIHRIQRIPENDSLGRMHTSTLSVAVLDKCASERISFNRNDCRVEYMRSSGPGGQSVNMANSCVRVTHLESKASVTCQKHRSSYENLEDALQSLEEKLQAQSTLQTALTGRSLRKLQVKRGERSEKSFTYNFQRDQVINHLFDFTFYGVQRYLKGDFLQETQAMYLLSLFKDTQGPRHQSDHEANGKHDCHQAA